MSNVNANNLIYALVNEVRNGNLKKCESMGLNIEVMQILNKLTLEDLHYLTNSSVSIMTFDVNVKNLNILLAQATSEKNREQNITRALNLGASIEIMSKFFGLTGTEVTAKRRLAGIHSKIGRNETATDEKSEAIYRYWEKNKLTNLDSVEALEMMMVIAEKCQSSLTTVYTLIKEWSKV